MKIEKSEKLVMVKDLLQSYIDLYLVVAQALYVLSERGLVIEQPNLIDELSLTIQELHYQGAVRFINSCLKELIENAVTRFV